MTGNPKATWASNIEPDVISGGQYKIYRALEDPWGIYPYRHIATVNHVSGDIQTYIDYEVTTYRFPQTNLKYLYKVSAVDNTGLESVKSDEDWIRGTGPIEKESAENELAQEKFIYELKGNYPNPFNPSTTISFQLAEPTAVSLIVYNLLGEEVAVLLNTEFKAAGFHSVVFNASHLSSGTYIYTLQAGDKLFKNKMTLMK